jgi:hypothetical protein
LIELTIAIASILITLTEWLSIYALDSSEHYFVILLSQILFFNVAHVGFTFSILFLTPIGKSWLKDVLNWSVKKALVVNLILFAILSTSISYFFYWVLIEKSGEFISVFVVIQLLLVVVLPVHHRLSQSFGIFFNKKNRIYFKNQEDLHNFKKIFIALSVIGLTLVFLHKVINFNLELTYLTKVSISMILFFMCLKLIGVELKAQGTVYSSFKFLLWPMSIFSNMAIYAIIAIHGIEYAKVYTRMTKGSSFGPHILSLIFAIILIISYLIRPIGGTHLSDHFKVDFPVTVSLAAGLSYSLSLMHFGWDRIFFRMRDERVRKLLSAKLIDL